MKASVIILAWNGMAYLADCLNAVLAQDYPDFEVIVVDNGSADGSADFVAQHYPQVRLIRNERNLGFAAGNNIGLRAAMGDVLVLLNQDTEVRPGWLAALVAALQRPGVGIVGSKAYYPDGRIQHAGGNINDRGEGDHYGRGEVDQGQYDVSRAVDFVTGASLALLCQVHAAIGDLDEGFAPAYYEDVDWCYRARAAGFQVVYVPESVLVHKEVSTIADKTHEGMYVIFRGRLRFVLKHWPLERLTDEFVSLETTWIKSFAADAAPLIAAMHHTYLYYLLHLDEIITWRQRLGNCPPDTADRLGAVLLTLRAFIPLHLVALQIMLTPVNPDIPSASELAESPVETPDAALDTSIPDPLVTFAARLQQYTLLEPYEFQSDVPVIGLWIAGFRRQWNQVATEWYVKPVIEQQTMFNTTLMPLLEHLTQRIQTLESQLMFHEQRLRIHEQRLRIHEQRLRIHEQRLNLQDHNIHLLDMARTHLGATVAEYIRESGRELGELAWAVAQMRILLAEREGAAPK